LNEAAAAANAGARHKSTLREQNIRKDACFYIEHVANDLRRMNERNGRAGFPLERSYIAEQWRYLAGGVFINSMNAHQRIHGDDMNK
jgi:hypothetical protein